MLSAATVAALGVLAIVSVAQTVALVLLGMEWRRLDARIKRLHESVETALLPALREASETLSGLARVSDSARALAGRMAEAVHVVGTGVAVATAAMASFAGARVLRRGPMAWFFGLLAGAEIYCDAVAPGKEGRRR